MLTARVALLRSLGLICFPSARTVHLRQAFHIEGDSHVSRADGRLGHLGVRWL